MFLECESFCVSLCQGVEGQPFRRAERELALLHSFNDLLFSQRSCPREDSVKDADNSKTGPQSFMLINEFSES